MLGAGGWWLLVAVGLSDRWGGSGWVVSFRSVVLGGWCGGVSLGGVVSAGAGMGYGVAVPGLGA